MYKIGFVVLNYNTFDDTIEFVKSVKKFVKKDYEIIIVDNNSIDESGEQLKSIFQFEENIHIILNLENYGFSKGNNIGIKYAINELKCDFIIMTNSDTCIIQEDFCEKIITEYNESNAALIGPEVNNPDGQYQFPVEPNISIITLKKELFSLKIHYILNKINLDGVYLFLLKLIKYKKNRKTFINKRKEDVILHGSCIIFTPKYFEGELVGIPEKTRFYCEEQIIYLYAKKNNFKIVYNPEIKILHKKSSATLKTYKDNKKINDFKYKNKIDSTCNLIKYLLEEK